MHARIRSVGTDELDGVRLKDQNELWASEKLSGSIERIYRIAVRTNPTYRNRVALACYLAEHGQLLSAFDEFESLVQQSEVARDSSRLAEVADLLLEIEARFDDCASLLKAQNSELDQHWIEDVIASQNCEEDPCRNSTSASRTIEETIRQFIGGVSKNVKAMDVESLISRLDQVAIRDIKNVTPSLWLDRSQSSQRRCGCILLKLSRLCPVHQSELQAMCIRKAVEYFQQAATELIASLGSSMLEASSTASRR